MDNNKALLSQSEIDVLVKFLLDKKVNVKGEVLEQSSVDKLLHILQTEGQKLYFNSDVPQVKSEDETAIITLEHGDNIGEQQKFCELECELDGRTGYITISCINKNSGNRYIITPRCLEQAVYIKDDTAEWGYAVPPLTFDIVASLLQIKYSKETFDKVCEIYSERIYGDKSHSIPYIYMPSSQNLLQHLLG